MSSKERAQSEDKATVKRRSPQLEVQDFEVLERQIHPATIIRRARLGPRALSPRDVLQLQCTIRNQALSRLLAGMVQGQPANTGDRPVKSPSSVQKALQRTGPKRPGFAVQPNLTVGPAGDPYKPMAPAPLLRHRVTPVATPQEGLVQAVWPEWFFKKKSKKTKKKEQKKPKYPLTEKGKVIVWYDTETVTDCKTPVEWFIVIGQQHGGFSGRQTLWDEAKKECTEKIEDKHFDAMGQEWYTTRYVTDEEKLSQETDKIAQTVYKDNKERDDDLKIWLDRNKEMGLVIIWGCQAKHELDLTSLSGWYSEHSKGNIVNPWKNHQETYGKLLNDIKTRIGKTKETYLEYGASKTEFKLDGNVGTKEEVENEVDKVWDAAVDSGVLPWKMSKKKE